MASSSPTTPNTTPTLHSALPTAKFSPAQLGGIIAGPIIATILASLSVWFYRRRYLRRKEQNAVPNSVDASQGATYPLEWRPELPTNEVGKIDGDISELAGVALAEVGHHGKNAVFELGDNEVAELSGSAVPELPESTPRSTCLCEF
jgi:hypothetical protein